MKSETKPFSVLRVVSTRHGRFVNKSQGYMQYRTINMAASGGPPAFRFLHDRIRMVAVATICSSPTTSSTYSTSIEAVWQTRGPPQSDYLFTTP
jgi:hypothetical protein